MKRKQFADDLQEKIEYFHQAFDRQGDLLSAVLRAHLMVEERLHDVISAGVADYTRPIEKNDIFSFGTALEIAKAIIGNKASSDLWAAVKELNNLRNAMSHRHKPKRLEKLLEAFFKKSEIVARWVYKEVPSYDHYPEKDDLNAIVIRTRTMAIWALLGMHADDLSKDLDNILDPRRPKHSK